MHPVNARHQRFVGGRSTIDGCGYLGRPPDKIRRCSFPQRAMVLRRISEQWHLRDNDELHTRSARYGAAPEFLGIGGLPLFPHQRRSAALREHDVKHRRTYAARNTLSHSVFRMMVDKRHYPSTLVPTNAWLCLSRVAHHATAASL
jgi:hypothetical protein